MRRLVGAVWCKLYRVFFEPDLLIERAETRLRNR
jgi:hypothetical protein